MKDELWKLTQVEISNLNSIIFITVRELVKKKYLLKKKQSRTDGYTVNSTKYSVLKYYQISTTSSRK